jgi:hypothetical protein
MIRKLLTIVVAAATLSGAGDATMAGAASPTLSVAGNGLSIARLGTGESAAMATITRAIGRPTIHLSADPGLENCGVSATATWHSMIVFFNRNRLVGLSFGPGHIPKVTTPAGLRLGDSLSQARAIYPKKLTTSGSQAGTWFAATPSGRIDGFLNPSTARAPQPNARIETIEVGVVGCPAMSP